MSECPQNPLKKGRDGGEHGRVFTEMNLCCLQEFTEVTNGVKSGKVGGTGEGDGVEVRNRYEALTEEEEDKEERHQEKKKAVIRRWSRNASQKKEQYDDALICVECQPELNHGATLCSRPCSGHGGGLCPGYSQAPEVSASGDPLATASGAKGETACLGLFQEMHQDCLNGCDEKIDEWEEIEFLVDSGASATVVNTNQVKAVKASHPDPNKYYKMADGSTIYNKGEKLFRAATDECRAFKVRTQVADVDTALLSVAEVVDRGGRVVFDQRGSYIETKDDQGNARRGHLEYRRGTNIMRLWIPRDQGTPFQGQA